MVRERPPVVTALLWAYRDLYRALRTGWRLALVAHAVLSVGTFVVLIGPWALTHDPVGQSIARQGLLIVLAFLLTPFLLSVHRFVLLGEAPKRYDLDPANRRFQLFFGWLAVILLLASIPSFLKSLNTPWDPNYYVGEYGEPAPSIMVTVAGVVVFALIQRFLVLFPAVAVDAPGIAWQNAIRDTHNHMVFVVVVTIVPFVPVVLVVAMCKGILQVWRGTLVGLIVDMLWFGALLLLISTLLAVIASRLYQVLGERLNAPLPET
jgi:hypothetical protein